MFAVQVRRKNTGPIRRIVAVSRRDQVCFAGYTRGLKGILAIS